MSDSTMADDVADRWFADNEKTITRRRRFRSDESRPERVKDMRLIREIDLKVDDEDESTPDMETEQAAEGESAPQGRYWRWYVRPRSADDDGSKTAQKPVRWDDHTNQVTAYARNIAAKLGLPGDLEKALELAARF